MLLWVGLAAGAAALVCCGAFALNSTGDNTQSGGTGGGNLPAGVAAQPEPGIGEPVRDGKFEFTVQEVQCGVQSVGSSGLAKTAQGRYCLVTLQVKNIGDKPQTMFDSNQKGFGSNNAQYSTDSEAGLYANSDNSQVWITEINPGNQVTGVLVFDMPQDVELVRLELHDSAFSGGVNVTVK